MTISDKGGEGIYVLWQVWMLTPPLLGVLRFTGVYELEDYWCVHVAWDTLVISGCSSLLCTDTWGTGIIKGGDEVTDYFQGFVSTVEWIIY